MNEEGRWKSEDRSFPSNVLFELTKTIKKAKNIVMKAIIKFLSLINNNISSSNQSRFYKSYGSWRFNKNQNNLNTEQKNSTKPIAPTKYKPPP